MPKTLLVVDDSITMRKVFELTFGGEDFNVVTHEGGDSLLARARDARPDAAVVDVNLGGPNGYDVVRALKGDAALGGVPVLLLFSEQSPVDEGKVRDCGADGTLQKPFDTQACIDRLKQLVGASTGAPTQAAAPATAAAAVRSTVASATSAPPAPASKLPSSAGVGSVGAAPAKPAKATQMFGPGSLPFVPPAQGGASAAPPPARPAPAPPAALSRDSAEIELTVDGEEEMSFSAPPARTAAPTAAPARPAMPAPTAAPARPAMPAPMAAPARPAPAPAPATPAARPAAAAVPASSAAPMAAISADVGQRVAAMGLTPAQADAVAALTREVVERVVWEVVPQLAETLIREEIRRLTAE